MGVNLSPILLKEEVTLSYFDGKAIALDAFNHIYQFLASIRQEDGTPLKDFKGNVTSHLSGLFYRTIKLIEYGIKPVYVFDGPPPSFKIKEIKKRKEEKEEALLKFEKAEDIEDLELMRRYAKESLKLTPDMVEESKELLKSMGVAVVDSPTEGEAEAAYLAKVGKVYASSSQDYDSLLFSSPRLVRNLSITGKRKLPRKNQYVDIKPEIVNLEENLKHLGIELRELVYVAILVGTDYNVGVKGIGPKTALSIVKQYKKWDLIKKYVESKYNHIFEDYIDEVIEFFLYPPVKDVDFYFGDVEEDKIFSILVDRHDFSEERVKTYVEKLKSLYKSKRQKRLFDFM